ncbi:MAG: AAA family ATPase, partial [Burkholderiales bacterium]|nr:AAA family ATPase [Burkholderiales bacterium]
MDLEAVLKAAVELLERRRRVTCRWLQRELGLDDATFDDLRDELILGQRVAREVDGQVLVWVEREQSAPAERRQLTVMFCDLVGSTRLSGRLDPEDWRDVIRSYHEQCAAVLRPSGGHIAQYLGDGLLVYFGYPSANEDDAERAVGAGLAIVQAIRQLSARLAARIGSGLSVRVGIHTGLVVIGGASEGDGTETLALGEAPNLAAHIQSRAAPDTVLISQATLGLISGRFLTEDLGPQVLKDPAYPVRLAQVLGKRGERVGAPRAAPRQRLVDPAGSMGRLGQAWEASRERAQVLLLRGEAGLGKTRLGEELCEIVTQGGARARVLRCSGFHRQSALHPVAQHLLQRAGVNPDAPTEDAALRVQALMVSDGLDGLDGLEGEGGAAALALIAALVAPGSAAAAPARALAPAQLMQSMQALLLGWLDAMARQGPTLVLFEDLHWADPSTLALLGRFVAAGPPPMLLLLTARPDFDAPALAPTSAIELRRLPDAAIREVVAQVGAARALPKALVERIVETAEGVPLYAEEITRSVLECADDTLSIEVPASLQGSLTARLDRMGPAKLLAQTAALLGREFSSDLLGAVSELPPYELERTLQQLTEGDILLQLAQTEPPRYAFRHALLQAAAGESLLRSARLALHRRVADVLISRFAGTVQAEPETLARHLSEAGEMRPAIQQWQRAGEHALARSATSEALAHLSQGLDLVAGLAAGAERDALELALQIPRASALRALQGVAAPATGAAYERACGLASELGDRARLIPALNGLYSYRMVAGQCDAALAPAQRLLDVAQAGGDRLFEMIGHRAVGGVAFHLGDLGSARTHLERALALYEPEQHGPLAFSFGIDHKVVSANFLALTLLVQGEVEAARAVQRSGLEWAEALGHDHSTAQALVFGCLMHVVNEDWNAVPARAERTIALGQRRGFPLMVGGGRFLLGAARAFGGEPREGLRVMEEGSALWWGTGARNYRPLAEMLHA